LSVNYQYVRPMFRDVTFIKELHYLDFKLWILKKVVYNKKTTETKIETETLNDSILIFHIYYKPVGLITNKTQPISLNTNEFAHIMYTIDDEDFVFKHKQ
jgi:hypothetical protein